MYDRRREYILELLQEHDTLAVREIAQRLHVSEMTVRRDLIKMEQEGSVYRSFGGVSFVKGLYIERPIAVRAADMPQEKRKMAMIAANMVEDGDSVFLDGGTTIYELSKYLAKKRIYIATSSIQTSMGASKGIATVYLSGGQVDKKYKILLGPSAQRFYRSINCKYAFVSAGGVSIDKGVTEYTEEGAALKRTMLEQAEIKVLIVDHTKFDVARLFKSADLRTFHFVITDQQPQQAYCTFFKENQIELIIASEAPRMKHTERVCVSDITTE